MDMTIECIYAKLSYLFGKVRRLTFLLKFFVQDYSGEKIKKMMMKNLRGELTDVKNKNKYSMSNSKMVMAISQSLNVKDQDSIKEINQVLTPVLVNSTVSTVRKIYYFNTFIVKFGQFEIAGARIRRRFK